MEFHMAEAISILIMFLPLAVILWVANLADHQREQGDPKPVFAAASYVLLVLIYGMMFLGGLAVQAAGLMVQAENGDPLGLVSTYQEMGIDPAVIEEVMDSLPLIGVGLWLPALVGVLLVLPPVRRLLARVIPINPASTVHAIALAFSMLVVVNLLLTLGIGLGTLSEIMAAADAENDVGGTIATVWAQNIGMAILALVGVGWFSRRHLRAALDRLGVIRPSDRELAIGLGLGLGLVPVVMALEFLASLAGTGFDAEVERLTEQLLGPLFQSIPGILTIGLAAALGEELIFRGALQPRFGLFLTSLLFALTHSTYGITLSTLVVFLLGMVLGWVRQRHNTSTAMVVHAVYNMTLGLIAFLTIQFGQNF
jgi:uncharacterized protein